MNVVKPAFDSAARVTVDNTKGSGLKFRTCFCTETVQ